jgi:nucleoside-diphosphate-sugar epimerase
MVVITGASGLLGIHLVKVLSAGHLPVKALYHMRLPKMLPGTVEANVQWQAIDILNYADLEEAFVGATHVYHAAGFVSYDVRDREKLFQINEEGTAYVVDACLACGVKKLGFVSSVATLGHPLRAGDLIDENAPIDEEAPVSVYARSKQKAEREVWRGYAEGLDMVIVNPAIILGEGDGTQSSSTLYKKVYDEFAWYTEGATGWVDAADVALVMEQLMASTVGGQRFVVCAENRPFVAVFTGLAAVMQKRPPRYKASAWITEVVWRIDSIISRFRGSKPVLTRETARAACEQKGYSSAKLLDVLPQFQFRGMDETLERTGRYFLSVVSK